MLHVHGILVYIIKWFGAALPSSDEQKEHNLTLTQSGLLVTLAVLYKYHCIKTNIQILNVPSHYIIEALPRKPQEQKNSPHVPSCSRIILLLEVTPGDFQPTLYGISVTWTLGTVIQPRSWIFRWQRLKRNDINIASISHVVTVFQSFSQYL